MTHEVARDGELVLRQHDDGSFELRANGVFVMDTLETSSERALASRALSLATSPRHVLVGGLGLGFTLMAVLDDDRVRRVTVVEVEPALVEWMSDGTIPHGRAPLRDPRVEVVVADALAFLKARAPASYDLILLDVDNGPGYLVHDENADLYQPEALTSARRATRPGGQVVIWSGAEAPDLFTAMRESFASAEEMSYAVDLNGRSETYWLYAGLVADGYYEGTTDPS